MILRDFNEIVHENLIKTMLFFLTIFWLTVSKLTIEHGLSFFSSYRRVTRSNSVTTAVQADLDLLEGLGDDQFTQTHQAPIMRQPSQDAATSTVSIQGSGNHYHACVLDDFTDMDFDPSILPPPDPWMDGAMDEEYASGMLGFMCPQDGRWFLKLLQAEVERMEGWCKQMEQDERENELPEDSE